MARRAQTHGDRYEVLVGLNYPPHGDRSKPEKRAEPGAVVDDLPAGSVPWLLDQAAIRPAAPEAEEGDT